MKLVLAIVIILNLANLAIVLGPWLNAIEALK